MRGVSRSRSRSLSRSRRRSTSYLDRGMSHEVSSRFKREYSKYQYKSYFASSSFKYSHYSRSQSKYSRRRYRSSERSPHSHKYRFTSNGYRRYYNRYPYSCSSRGSSYRSNYKHRPSFYQCKDYYQRRVSPYKKQYYSYHKSRHFISRFSRGARADFKTSSNIYEERRENVWIKNIPPTKAETTCKFMQPLAIKSQY